MKSYIELKDVSASINDYKVLDKINIKIIKGKIYGIVGQNGSGKTTFSELLIGHKRPDSGEIIIDGQAIDVNIKQSLKYGIHMIHQKPNLLKDLSVFENVNLNLMGKNSKSIFTNKRKMIKRTKEVFNWMGIDIDIHAKISELRYFEQQLVEFAKVAICSPNVLILDEPTCSLLDDKTTIYLNAIRKLNAMGTTIIFISHRIEIISKLADKVFVFKNKNVVEYEGENISENNLLECLTEQKTKKSYPKLHVENEDILFELRNLKTSNNSISDINITVRKGEIVGITGLYGSGKTSIGNAIYGLESIETGQMFLQGQEVPLGSPDLCIKHGIGYIHENIIDSLVQNHTVQDNIILGNFDKLEKHILMTKEICQKTTKYVKQLNLKCAGNDQVVSSYSIGSQQKIIFAKWLLANPSLIIIDEPTKSVDIISKVELYNIINAMVRQQKGVILMSSDLDELIGMCDQIIIMYEGRIIKRLKAKNSSKKEILYYAMGKGQDKEYYH